MIGFVNIKPICLGYLLVLVLLLNGCGSKQDSLDSYVQSVLARPSGAIEEIPAIRSADSFVYDPTDLRNPFGRSQREEEQTQSSDGPRPDPNRRKEFLERFPLDTLGMVGTYTSQDQVWGLIEDTEGVVHRVQQDNYIGQNHGRIIVVLPDRVDIVELLPNGDGSWAERESSISLDQGDA